MFRITFIIYLAILLFISQLSYSQGFRELETKDSLNTHTNIDVSLFRAINNNRCGLSNAIIPLTDKSVLPFSIAVPIGLAGISRIDENYYDENSAVLLLLSEITSTGITFGMKQVFKRERPFVTLRNVSYDKYNSPTDRYSFPSGHTATAFSMATSLTLRYPDKPVIIAMSYLYAAIIGYGRMYLGVHYPSDVIGGMIIGSGSAALIYSLRKEIIDVKNNLFNEKYKQDTNNINEMPAYMILGMSIGADLLNNLLQDKLKGNKVTFSSGFNNLTASINF